MRRHLCHALFTCAARFNPAWKAHLKVYMHMCMRPAFSLCCMLWYTNTLVEALMGESVHALLHWPLSCGVTKRGGSCNRHGAVVSLTQMRYTHPNHTAEVVEHDHQLHYLFPAEGILKYCYLNDPTHKAEVTRERETRAHYQHWVIRPNLVQKCKGKKMEHQVAT